MKKKYIIEIVYIGVENEPSVDLEEIMKPFFNLGIDMKEITIKTKK